LEDINVTYTIRTLGFIHLFFSILMTISYMWNWTPVILFDRHKEREEQLKQQRAQSDLASGIVREEDDVS